MLVRNRSFQIIIYILLFTCLVNSEPRISELNRIQLKDSEHILPFNKNRFLSWDKNKVNLDDMIIYKETEGQIINVILNSNQSNPLAAIVINNLSGDNNFSIRLLDNDGRINASVEMNKPFDVGIPKILFTNSKLLLMRPEEQQIQVYNFDGSKSGEFYLYNAISWSHEKKILTASDAVDKLFLLGMKSADLKNSQNVSLFKMDGKPKWIIDLPMTIPYFFSISNENIHAIIGTKNTPDNYHQIPFLIFLDNNQYLIHQPIKLKKLPRKTIWFKDELFLIYRDHLLIYNTGTQSPPQKIKLNSKIVPLDAFIYEESIFIISGNGIGVGQNGNYYDSISLVEYNHTTRFIVTHPLQEGPIFNVEHFPSDELGSFYLKLNSQLVQFYITK